MSTTRSFNDMLNDYLPFDLLKDELIKRNYILTNIQKDNNWKGGELVVPFKGGMATSYKYGSLTAANDISEDKYVRGSVSGHREVWGSMLFNDRDIMDHKGAPSEQSFLKILPDTLDDFMEGFKEAVSVNLLAGTHMAKLTSDASANDGLIVVDHPERFSVNQKVIVDDDNSVAQTGYVAHDGSGINLNTSTIKLYTTRGGATVVDFSATPMTVAQNAKVYIDGAETAANAFTPLKDQLLSAANGGSASLFGQSKLLYPYLQAINVSGSDVTASNILEKIFDGWVNVNKKGRKGATDAVMSYGNLASVMKLLEVSSGPYTHMKQPKASAFGWTEISVVGVNGELKLVGVQEMDQSEIMYLDWNALKFYSNGMFKVHEDLNGQRFYIQRATTGYSYIVDACCFGEQILYRPSQCGILHGISY